MKVFNYILKYKFLSVLVVVFLALQATFSMLLPFITSDVINVGIQQYGIKNIAPEYISFENYDELNDGFRQEQENNAQISSELNNNVFNSKLNTMSSLDTLDLNMFYDEKDNNYCINQLGKDNWAILDSLLNKPLVKIHNYEAYVQNNISKQTSIFCTRAELDCAGIDINSYQMNYIINEGTMMLIVALLITIAMTFQSIVSNIIGQRVARDKRKELFSSVIRMQGSEFVKFSESSLITRATNDIQLIQNMSVTIFQSIAYAPILVCVGVFFAVKTAPSLIWIVVLAILLVIVAAYIMVKYTVPYFSRMQLLFDRVNLIAREALSGIYVTRSFNREKYEEKRFNKSNKELYKVQLLTGRITAVITPLLTLGYNAMTVLIILIGGIQITSGNIQVGDLVAFTTYCSLIVSGFVAIGMFIGSLPRVNVAVDRVESAINAQQEQDAKGSSEASQSFSFNDIEFDNVSLSYESQPKVQYVLKDISFKIKKGESCGIIGTVGSGKSTIVKLINRRISPSQGKILVNGLDVSKIPLNSYRSSLAYSPQQSFLFSGTVLDNVGYGLQDNSKNKRATCNQSLDNKDKADDTNKIKKNRDKVKQALEDAQLADMDIDGQISQDSTNISGGQRQRLSVARALAKDGEVLLFDDCFTALDFKTEKNLRENIKEKKQTKIIVSSRLSSVMYMDKIIVLDRGKIVGQGTHKDLLKNCAEYINIAKAQLEEM